MRVSIDEMASAVMKELESYSGRVAADIKADAVIVANECRDEIKANAPKRTGKYRGSWSVQKAYESGAGIRLIVHAKSPHHRLTHLLEKGHAKRGGGRVEGKPHIGPAEEKAVQKMLDKAKEAVKP